ncbi:MULTISPECIES: MarR family winged helix-turn-helix transcriptional regulator [Bifidobacterium]|nr:MarR family transcriptional regulator [Bifidobacterium tibiigranuli]MCH3974075.1 MarR family transcriptional regulator [Bifidobacterium tibiigranuli]MCH4189105.1 MarR family transcriptional regulator [Bifidobacterium tibiigranuli]MCH4204065.1 MarR family transcriptional regulator [Bifidobacterium tibiigranuli]MCH4274428.1 MarR family transcriptional regulator [Bifidobacterium tibiigranuli]MCI1211098.1 MarR family transcriptional regulator [Bifidobacterium tibiigranuli]
MSASDNRKDAMRDTAANETGERGSRSASLSAVERSAADPPAAVAENIVAIEYEALLLGKRINRVAGFRGSRLGMLDRSAYILLVSLEDRPMSIGELSEITGLDASTLNRQTAAMRRQNMIERIPDPDGGMARKFTLTQEGEHSLAQQRKRNLGALSTVLADWSPDEISQFAAALTRFNRAVQSLATRIDRTNNDH